MYVVAPPVHATVTLHIVLRWPVSRMWALNFVPNNKAVPPRAVDQWYTVLMSISVLQQLNCASRFLVAMSWRAQTSMSCLSLCPTVSRWPATATPKRGPLCVKSMCNGAEFARCELRAKPVREPAPHPRGWALPRGSSWAASRSLASFSLLRLPSWLSACSSRPAPRGSPDPGSSALRRPPFLHICHFCILSGTSANVLCGLRFVGALCSSSCFAPSSSSSSPTSSTLTSVRPPAASAAAALQIHSPVSRHVSPRRHPPPEDHISKELEQMSKGKAGLKAWRLSRASKKALKAARLPGLVSHAGRLASPTLAASAPC